VVDLSGIVRGGAEGEDHVTNELDMEVVGKKAELLFGYLGGAAIAGMIYVGDELGIYRTMAGAGPLSSAALALRAGLNERFLREWLQAQAGAGILDYRGNGLFELSPEAALVVADESTPASTIGFFTGFPEQMAANRMVVESMKTGIGFNYDAGGPEVARGVERGFAPWYRAALVDSLKAGLGGTIQRLEVAGKVADVGCGGAVATIEMAKAWPKSQFHAYDNSLHALARAEANKKAAGVTNVTFHNPDNDPLPTDGSFDLVCCFDCLHDMTRPDLVGIAVHAALKPDGVWFIKDIAGAPTFEDNLAMNPMAGMMYSVSLMTCMASSAATPDGLALGTLGLPAPAMEKLVRAAGFQKFEVVPIEATPIDAFYLARP
jgi:SAM-dependent methyltransferase